MRAFGCASQDHALIQSLEDAKSLSRTVSEQMRVGAETQVRRAAHVVWWRDACGGVARRMWCGAAHVVRWRAAFWCGAVHVVWWCGQAVIQTSAERYRSVAVRGALLFFTMSALDKVNAMYKFSLNAFVVVFIRGIDTLRDAAGAGVGPVAGAGAAGKASMKRAVTALKGKLAVRVRARVCVRACPPPFCQCVCRLRPAHPSGGGGRGAMGAL